MLVTWLDAILATLKPTELYLPTPGMHQDHIAAYEAGMRAARKSYTDGRVVRSQHLPLRRSLVLHGPVQDPVLVEPLRGP